MVVAADDGGAVTTAGPGRARRAGAGRGLVTPGPPGPAAGPVLAGTALGPVAGPGGPGQGRPGRETAGTGEDGRATVRRPGWRGRVSSLGPGERGLPTRPSYDPGGPPSGAAHAARRPGRGGGPAGAVAAAAGPGAAGTPRPPVELAAGRGCAGVPSGSLHLRAGHWAEALAELRAARLTGQSSPSTCR